MGNAGDGAVIAPAQVPTARRPTQDFIDGGREVQPEKSGTADPYEPGLPKKLWCETSVNQIIDTTDGACRLCRPPYCVIRPFFRFPLACSSEGQAAWPEKQLQVPLVTFSQQDRDKSNTLLCFYSI